MLEIYFRNASNIDWPTNSLSRPSYLRSLLRRSPVVKVCECNTCSVELRELSLIKLVIPPKQGQFGGLKQFSIFQNLGVPFGDWLIRSASSCYGTLVLRINRLKKLTGPVITVFHENLKLRKFKKIRSCLQFSRKPVSSDAFVDAKKMMPY